MSAEAMQVIAHAIDDYFNGKRHPKRIGFALLVFPTDEPEGSRVNYVSSCSRRDMIAAMKEVVARLEGRAHPAPEAKQ